MDAEDELAEAAAEYATNQLTVPPPPPVREDPDTEAKPT